MYYTLKLKCINNQMAKSSGKMVTGSGPEVISLIFQIRNSAYMKSEKLGVSF